MNTPLHAIPITMAHHLHRGFSAKQLELQTFRVALTNDFRAD